MTNPGCLTLIETQTGQVTGLMPAAWITTHRTAMVSAIGAVALSRSDAQVVGCIGTAGIGVQAVRYIARNIALTEVRLHGRDPERTQIAAETLSAELGLRVVPVPDWTTCIDGADIVIDGTALPHDTALLPPEAVKPGAVVVVYGAYSSLQSSMMDHIESLVMDRWVADGRGGLGPLTSSGRLDEADVSAMIGDVLGGRANPRKTQEDRILFCHRGVAACDLTIANALLDAAKAHNIGTTINF